MISDDKFDAILARITRGESATKACKAEHTGKDTFWERIGADDDAANRYARAKSRGLEGLADESIDIADLVGQPIMDKDGNVVMWTNPETGEHEPLLVVSNEAIQHARLRIDTRKWLLAKLLPKKYGERTTIAGDADNPLAIADVTSAVLGKLLPEAAEGSTPIALGKPDD